MTRQAGARLLDAVASRVMLFLVGSGVEATYHIVFVGKYFDMALNHDIR
ncbi:MAG TPA: hypothetical protein VJU59_45645 [Paraburkholderia sp.]|nr:hypothetical protein [Paraburkholderia sp.]HKR46876.1 hypothetical protein [Paraburkholderia sp.]